jgi:hypothetical protein
VAGVAKDFGLTIFRRVQKIAKSGCKQHHVCLPIGMEQLGSHYTDFNEFGY